MARLVRMSLFDKAAFEGWIETCGLEEYMQVLLRYIQERMLYRLSMSQYRDNFCLKGSALLFAYEKFKACPTKDIDFLDDKISRDKETIRKAFREICTIQCHEDGLTFDNGENDIKVEDIYLDKEYNGVTVTVTAHLDAIVQPYFYGYWVWRHCCSRAPGIRLSTPP